MSCNYASGLSAYENKGVLGVPEKFESDDKVNEKCLLLAEWIRNAKHVVVHTGAGISTAAGIPDFRGPNGVWTLEKEGRKPDMNIPFGDAIPTKTHLSLKCLIENQYIHYVVSQNIDGLHLRTGISRTYLAELHGNMFIGQCDNCYSQFIMPLPSNTVGQKYLNKNCKRSQNGRHCRGKLRDTVLDWEADLPEYDLEISDYQSSMADINICFGTTLQIIPSGNLPLKSKKYGGKLVIINLQPTKHDQKADLIINTYSDNVMEKLMKHLNLEIPVYTVLNDPTKNQIPQTALEWKISTEQRNRLKKQFDCFTKNFYKTKRKSNQKGIFVDISKNEKKSIRKKVKKNCKRTFTYSIESTGLTSGNISQIEDILCKNETSDIIDLTLASGDDI